MELGNTYGEVVAFQKVLYHFIGNRRGKEYEKTILFFFLNNRKKKIKQRLCQSNQRIPPMGI